LLATAATMLAQPEQVLTLGSDGESPTGASGSSAQLLPPVDTQSQIDMAKREAQQGELINAGTDERFVQRDKGGKLSESDDVDRSLSQDRRRRAKRTVKLKGR
jgi:hypothetical protein